MKTEKRKQEDEQAEEKAALETRELDQAQGSWGSPFQHLNQIANQRAQGIARILRSRTGISKRGM